MPGGLPISLDLCNAQNISANTAASKGRFLTAGTPAHTKGSYTQLIASTSADCVWMIVMICAGSGNQAAVDIAIGAPASEVVIANNLLIANENTTSWFTYAFPCQIPAGTAISARIQSTTASDALVQISVILLDGGFQQIEGCAGVDAIGFNAGTTVGTNTTPSASAVTKGSFAQLTASTTRDYVGLILEFDPLNAAVTAYQALIDLAIGGAGVEQVIIPNVSFFNTGVGFVTTPFFVNVPAGTRLSARCESNSASSANIGVVAYGIYL